MAKSSSSYIQFYTAGSSACKVELRKEQEWAPLPQLKPVKKIVIAVDPVAILGFLVAVSMLVLMAVGIQQLNGARQEVAMMERYVAQLTAQNQELSQQYAESYDLETIRVKAMDMGMVPAEEVAHTQLPKLITVADTTEEPQQTSPWHTFLVSLFA